jgi:hypothetical protein
MADSLKELKESLLAAEAVAEEAQQRFYTALIAKADFSIGDKVYASRWGPEELCVVRKIIIDRFRQDFSVKYALAPMKKDGSPSSVGHFVVRRSGILRSYDPDAKEGK